MHLFLLFYFSIKWSFHTYLGFNLLFLCFRLWLHHVVICLLGTTVYLSSSCYGVYFGMGDLDSKAYWMRHRYLIKSWLLISNV